MSRKVRKIDDENHPGHGFWQVEGMNGHYDEHTAKRVAAQLDKAAEAPTEKPSHASHAVSVSQDGSVTCPSCGHRFKAQAPAGETVEGDDDSDDSDADSDDSDDAQE